MAICCNLGKSKNSKRLNAADICRKRFALAVLLSE